MTTLLPEENKSLKAILPLTKEKQMMLKHLMKESDHFTRQILTINKP
jgi:hypothetical protein